MSALTYAAGWVLVLFLGLLGVIVLWKIATIDLSMLLSEDNGKASLSRFQFLVFTFIYALSLVVVILKTSSFPLDIPLSAFTLMGISAGTFLASKGIQNSRDGNPTIADTAQARAIAVQALGTPEFAESSRSLADAASKLAAMNIAATTSNLTQASERLSALGIAALTQSLVDAAQRISAAAELQARAAAAAVAPGSTPPSA